MLLQTAIDTRAAARVFMDYFERLPATAVYCRTATFSEIGIETQVQLLTEYAANHGYEVSAMFVDNGESGSHINRPAFQQMLLDIQSGNIKRVLITELSRLSRNFVLNSELLALFRKYGVEVIAVNDGFNSNDDPSDSERSFAAVLYDCYAQEMRNRAKRTMAARQCQPFA